MEAATDGAYRLNIGFQYPGQAYYTEAGKETYNQKNAGEGQAAAAARPATRARSSSCSPTATTRTCTTPRW